jgi:nitrate reductase NapE component
VLAMNSVHHGWFFNNKEWIEYIILTVGLWLLMMIAIHELDLRSAG